MLQIANSMNVNLFRLNDDIKRFPQVHPITADMHQTREGISRLVMLDRYSFKDSMKMTLKDGDFVVVTVKDDEKYPSKGLGKILQIDRARNKAMILVEEEFRGPLKDEEAEKGIIERGMNDFEKPLEIYYEQICHRVARGLAEPEQNEAKRKEDERLFYEALASNAFVPAGRVLYGAGSGTQVTYFNCYVMPFIKDSREGISDHRKMVMEIMSRGGGVGTNGSTLRPKHARARGVNGRSSGSVSWLNDIATLTHLVEQGGSRRGAQMLMMADWAPDIVEFIVSKMQNPDILRYLLRTIKNEFIKEHIQRKLTFNPLTDSEKRMHEQIVALNGRFDEEQVRSSEQILEDGGTYDVINKEFLSGANISVTITNDFMDAVKNDEDFHLRFPDIENYSKQEMKDYNEMWSEVGDVREWERMGYGIKTYQTLPAKELWNLINTCATYSAEPGIFYIDNANDMTNASAYGHKVVATNPCGKEFASR
ncbi:ribonucleotide reductase (plasmid) [Pontibacillus sp. ALD_SL1]|nr:ribonucleotide reductase [Pontibacillus sp. ALD_SL1]